MYLQLRYVQTIEDIPCISSLGFAEVSAISLPDLYSTPFLQHHVLEHPKNTTQHNNKTDHKHSNRVSEYIHQKC